MSRLPLIWMLCGCVTTPASSHAPDDLSAAPDLRIADPDDLAPFDQTTPDLAEPIDAAEATDLAVPSPEPADAAAPPDLFVGITAGASATSAVTALVTISAPGATSVSIDYGPTIAYGSSTPAFAVVSGGAAIPILGLNPAATSHYRVNAVFPASSAHTADLTVVTPSAPFSFPVFTVTTSGPTDGYVLASVGKTNIGIAAAMLVNRAGKIMWYRVNSPPSTRAWDSQRQPNGHFTVFQNNSLTFEELDLAGNLLRTWSSPSALGADGHDILLLPTEHALLFGTTSHVIDGGTTVLGSTIEELHPDGGTVFSWNSQPEVGLDETAADINKSNSPVDALHPNAVEVAPDGNFYASFRHLDAILKIDRTANHVVWRLGGAKNDFTFVDDPQNGFSHQHDVRVVDGGDLMLLDNGNSHSPPRSRVVIYHLDENAKTAKLVWSYTHNPPIFSLAAGSARRLSNGHTVVTWAIQGQVTEIDADQKVVWEMNAAGWTLYRGLPISTLYP